MASPADGVQQAPVAKPQKVLRPLHFVLPVLASIAHAYWLASLKAGVVAEFAASPDGTLSIPWRVPVAIGALYVAGVLLGVRVFKAREGQKKPAAQISEAMVVYNIYASVLSLYMGAGMFLESIAAGRGGFTATMDKVHGGELCWLLYANMMSKFLEYLDTVFMIVKYNWRQVRGAVAARRLQHARLADLPGATTSLPLACPTRVLPLQITFLHVSHHAEMGWVIWVVSRSRASARVAAAAHCSRRRRCSLQP